MRYAVLLVIVVTVVATVQKYARDNVNNYLMFTRTLTILAAHERLYVAHPESFQDVFKYSPTFPLIMAPFALQPDLTGVVAWNLSNVLLFVVAIRRLLDGDDRRTLLVLALGSVDLLRAVQHHQSNALVAALIMLAFAGFEREQPRRAAFFTALGFFIKIYGASVAIFALFLPRSFRFWRALALWSTLLGAAPLLLISWNELRTHYVDWFRVLHDFRGSSNVTVMAVDRALPAIAAHPVRGRLAAQADPLPAGVAAHSTAVVVFTAVQRQSSRRSSIYWQCAVSRSARPERWCGLGGTTCRHPSSPSAR